MLHSHKKGNALVDLIIAMIIMGLVSISVVGAYTSLMSMASNSFRNSQASWFGNSVMEIYSAKAFGDIIADNNFTLNDQFPGYTADITVEPKDVDLSTSTFAAGGGDSKYKEITVTAFNNVSSNSFTLKTIIRDPAVDRDGDGVNDSEDACPDDPNESVDTDGDGVCDNSDAYPVDPTRTGGAIYTFTNCEKEGQSGPSQEQCNSEYGEGVVTVTVDNGIQEWTVPETGAYTIEVWGAQGGPRKGYDNDNINRGGTGAILSGDFSLTEDLVLKIIVGQRGRESGGGGGTFVATSENIPLIVAGGGAAWCSNSGCADDADAVLTEGNGGGGGTGCGSGGGGFYGNGTTSLQGYGTGGLAFVNGGTGGDGDFYQNIYVSEGGFGSGGGASNCCIGGGGGYTGGKGAAACDAKGGHSYFNPEGSSRTDIGTDNTGHGKVIITFIE